MQINPYLMFKGNCSAALKFYGKVLGVKVVFQMTYGESPQADETPMELRQQIMHARFIVGSSVLMASDCPHDRYDEPKGMVISISIESPTEAEKVFAALAEKGKISMPIQETFWAQRFGMLTDEFSIPWMVNCEKKG